MAQRSSLAPLTGVAFVVLLVLAFIIGGESPDIEDSPAKLVDYYQDEEGRTFAAVAVLSVAAVFFLFFLGVLRGALRSAGGAAEWLSSVAFAGGIVTTVGILSFAGFGFALADTADKATPEAIQALHILSSDFFFLVAGGQGAFLIAAGLAAIRAAALPAWAGWTALLLGIAAVTPAGFVAFLGSLLWILIISVLLWQAPAGSAPPPAQIQPHI